MECLHPFCPGGGGAGNWEEVLDLPQIAPRKQDKPALLAALSKHCGVLSTAPTSKTIPVPGIAVVKRLVQLCPCLFNQLSLRPTAEAIVHLCELTLGAKITAANVYDAFLVQYPKKQTYKYPPLKEPGKSSGGTIMEMFCSEVLENEQIPRMKITEEKWPVWSVPGHILLNKGNMRELQALGDILVPCAPTNLLISVKTEAARERLLYSANSIEGIGFGFFSQPEEFWSPTRMLLYKRMGFSAIYMPGHTLESIEAKLLENEETRYAVNLNGTALYRPLTQFGEDMRRVVGKSSFAL